MNQGNLEAVKQETARVNAAVVESVDSAPFSVAVIHARAPSAPFSVAVTHARAPTTNAEVELFYEDLQDLLELAPKKMSFSSRGLECKSRKSKDTWSNRQVWPWNTE